MPTTRVPIQKEFTLPSRGKFPGVPEKITFRAMSMLDEKRRLAGTGIDSIIDLVSNCTVSPENFDAHKMSRIDLDFSMIMIRILSLGPEYKINVVCPDCDTSLEETIDLEQLLVTEVPEDFETTFEIGPLPQSGDVLQVKLLTYEDENRIAEEAKRVISKFPNYKGNPADVLDYVYKIVSVNGESLKYVDLKSYVESMTAADSVYFDQKFYNLASNYGIDTKVSVTCKHCGSTFTRSLPMTSEFFRPRF